MGIEKQSLPDMSEDMEFLKLWLTGRLSGLAPNFTFSESEFEKAIEDSEKLQKQIDEIIRFLKDYKYIK